MKNDFHIQNSSYLAPETGSIWVPRGNSYLPELGWELTVYVIAWNVKPKNNTNDKKKHFACSWSRSGQNKGFCFAKVLKGLFLGWTFG